MTRFGLFVRLAVLAAAFLALAPLQYGALKLKATRLAGVLPICLHRLFLRLFGLRVEVQGTAPEGVGPILVLANHVSWLDIPVMSSLLPLSFVAKQEIAGWPIFGVCAKLQRCIFLDRARKAATAIANAEMAARLRAGDVIVLFPEGTTGDGNRLLPFRSSLVGAARAALAGSEVGEIRLQPLAISYTRRNGLPVTRRERPDIAWYGDMDLPPHFLAFARGGPLDVVVVWGEPIPFGPKSDRKQATLKAERIVKLSLARCGGRELAPQPYSLDEANSL